MGDSSANPSALIEILYGLVVNLRYRPGLMRKVSKKFKLYAIDTIDPIGTDSISGLDMLVIGVFFFQGTTLPPLVASRLLCGRPAAVWLFGGGPLASRRQTKNQPSEEWCIVMDQSWRCRIRGDL